MIVYDIEIVNAITDNKTSKLPDIKYCNGWNDKSNMGISVIGCYDFETDRFRVFCKDNFNEFVNLVNNTDIVCGFNSINFDNEVVKAEKLINIPKEKSYDLLIEVWKALGLGSKFEYPSHAGYSLDAIAKTNTQYFKTGNGALAPILWQQGKIGSVIDYCLEDVKITKILIQKVMNIGGLKCPKTGNWLKIRSPYEVVK
jgi:hypothetical protein